MAYDIDEMKSKHCNAIPNFEFWLNCLWFIWML